MTLKNTNPWKLLSIGLLGIIAIGLFTPIDAAPQPKEIEATEVDCENPCIDETELTFDPATQEELDLTNTAGGILEGTVAGLILDLATETSEREAADTAEATARADADTAEATARADADTTLQGNIDAEETRALTAEAVITSDLVDHETADGDLDSTNEIQTLSESSPGVIALSDSGGSVAVQDRVGGTCSVGSSIREIAADGTVTCESDDDTKYDAGLGLEFNDVAKNQFDIDTTTIQKRVSGACKIGSITAIAEDGTVICQGVPYVVTKGNIALLPGVPKEVDISCDLGDFVLNAGFDSSAVTVNLVEMFQPDVHIQKFVFQSFGVLDTVNVGMTCLDFGTPHT